MFLVGVDRDGTIIEDVDYLGRRDNWIYQIEFTEEVFTGLWRLTSKKDFKVVVITNQAGIARGFFDCKRVEEINQTLDRKLKEEGVVLDGWYYCPFVTKGYAYDKKIPLDSPWIKESYLRKPGIRMLEKFAKDFGIRLCDFEGIYVVGDKTSDIRTGLNAKGKGIWFRGNEYEFKKEYKRYYKDRVFIAKNWEEVSDIIIKDSMK